MNTLEQSQAPRGYIHIEPSQAPRGAIYTGATKQLFQVHTGRNCPKPGTTEVPTWKKQK